MPPSWTPPSGTPPTLPWTPPNRTPPLELLAADAPECHQPVLALDAADLGQDAADLGQDAADLAPDATARPARAAGRR